MRNDESIVILPADKGNATVVMDRTDYDEKVNSILNSVTYIHVQCDPIRKIERQVHQQLKLLVDKGEIDS